MGVNPSLFSIFLLATVKLHFDQRLGVTGHIFRSSLFNLDLFDRAWPKDNFKRVTKR